MDKTDIIHVDVPTFIRLLELSREELKGDEPIHIIAEKMVELSKEGPITMDSYDEIISSYGKNYEQHLSELRRLSGL